MNESFAAASTETEPGCLSATSATQKKFEYTSATKLQWLACAIVCVFYISVASLSVRLAISKFHGWELIAAVAVGLLALKYAIAGGLFVIRRSFVWSKYTLDECLLTQNSFRHTVSIDLAKPHAVSYQFLFRECPDLKLPYYQCMVIRQDAKILRILPYHLTPALEPNFLPEDIRQGWTLYQGKHPWLILPTWLEKKLIRPK